MRELRRDGRNLEEFGGVWRNWEEFGGIWRNLEENKEGKGSLKFETAFLFSFFLLFRAKWCQRDGYQMTCTLYGNYMAHARPNQVKSRDLVTRLSHATSLASRAFGGNIRDGCVRSFHGRSDAATFFFMLFAI